MTQQELSKVIENHQHWLYEDCEGWENMRADLSGKNLEGLDLSKANLPYADLSYANLTHANLFKANLYRANLADANLTHANLSEACLYLANLANANLAEAQNVPFIPLACPDTGSFIGYKRADGLIVQLQILEDSKRCSATSRKCRCDKAKVLSIQNVDGSPADVKEVRSNYDMNFIYRVGEIVQVDDFDEDRFNECSTGIHFFINRQDAVDW